MWLDATTKSLEVVLAGAITTNQLPFTAAFGEVASDNSTSAAKGNDGLTNGTTPVTLVSAPASSFVRELRHATVFNADTVEAQVLIRLNVSGTRRTLLAPTIQPGESLTYDAPAGWRVLAADGALVTTTGGAPAASVPAGAVWPIAGPTVPDGWLECNGASLLRADFPDLFGEIGTTWGAIDGTHFSLPDFRGRLLLGAGDASPLANHSLGSLGGAEEHTLITAELPSHTHGLTDPGHFHGVTDSGHDHDANSGTFRVTGNATPDLAAGGDIGQSDASTAISTTGISVDSATIGIVNTDSAGADTPHSIMQPWAAILWIIKT